MTREEQRYTKEISKELEYSKKNSTKECGFQKINGFVYKFIGDFVYVCFILIPPIDIGKKMDIQVLFKYLPLDKLFWEIFEITEEEKQPKSFHVQGAFTAPLVNIKEWKVNIENPEDVDCVYRNSLAELTSLINEHHKAIRDLSKFKQIIKTQCHQLLNVILLEILEKNYRAALQTLDEAIENHETGGFLDSTGKSIFQYARDYCLRRV